MTQKLYQVFKRTFEALQFAKGSAERSHLNEDALTSEYMPSYKYLVKTSISTRAFKTKTEAEQSVTC